MRAHAQALRHARPAARTVLAGIRGWHGDDLTASVCCFALKDAAERRPAGITDALAEMTVPHHVGHPQIFEVDHVVGPDECQGRLVVKVAPLPPHVLVPLGKDTYGFLTALALFLAARDAPLGLLERLFPLPVMTWVLYRVASGGDQEHLQAQINARLLAGRRQGLGGHLHTGETDIPAVRFFGEGDGLDRAFHRPGPAYGDAPDLGQDQIAVIQPGAVVVLLAGAGVVAASALIARETGLLSRRYPLEECLIGSVQAGQHVLEDVRVDGRVLRERFADRLQFCLLLEAGGRDALPAAPPGDALLRRDVVERAAAPEDVLQRPFLLRCGPQLLLEGFPHRLPA